MKQKLLAQLAVALPVAAVTATSFSSAASAVTFTAGDALSFGIVADIQNISLVTSGPGPFPDVFVNFQPDVPAFGSLAPANVSGVSFSNISTDAAGFRSCNTGGLNSTSCIADPANGPDSLGNLGGIRDFTIDSNAPFTDDTTVNGTNGFDSFLVIQNDGSGPAPIEGGPTPGAASNWYFSLLTTTLENPDPSRSSLFTRLPGTSDDGSNCLAGSTTGASLLGCELELDFTASGKVLDTATNELAHVNYFYAVTGIELDSVNPDGTFNTTSFANAGNLRVAVKDVPEPGTVSSLLALGMVGSFGFLRQKSRK